MFNNFSSENPDAYEVMRESMIDLDRPQMEI
jgi:hypothetical protein